MDKSVAQKFAVVMSMFAAVFATIFVCGNIVNGGFTSDGYVRPLEKTGALVSYSDNYIDANVSDSDSDINFYTSYDGNVTIIEFVDDEKPEPTTLTDPNWNADEEYLYMTTVTTTGTYKAIHSATTTPASRKTTTIKRTTTKSTKKTAATTAKHTTTSTTTSKLTSATTTASSTKPTSTSVSVHTSSSTTTTTVTQATNAPEVTEPATASSDS